MTAPLSTRRLPLGRVKARAVSLSIAALLVLAFVSTLRVPRRVLDLRVGAGIETFGEIHNLLSPLTSVFFARGLGALILALIGVIVLIGESERLMGPWRTIVAFVVTAFAGAGIGMFLQSLGLTAHERWAVKIQELVVLDPFTPIAGTVLAASAFAGPLWRRRIRVLGLASVLLIFLYSGQAADLFRLIAALVGLGLGLLLNRRRPALHWARSSHHEARSLVSIVVIITAIGPFISIANPAGYGPMQPIGALFRNVLPQLSTVAQQCAPHLHSARCTFDFALARLNGPGPIILAPLPLLVLLVAAFGMLRGRRSAALVAIAVNLLLALLASFYYGFLPALGSDERVAENATGVEALIRLSIAVSVPLAVAILIALTLRHFTVRSPRVVARRFIAVTSGTLGALLVIYVGVGWLVRSQFHPVVTIPMLLMDAPDRFVPIGFLRLESLAFLPTGPVADLLYNWVGPVFWTVVLAACIPTFFSERVTESAAEREDVRRRLRSGGGSLGQLATWIGNSYWYSADRRVVIGYRVNSGVAITTADPIGPQDGWEAAVREFVVFCEDHGWTTAFYSVHDAFLPVARAINWPTMVVGVETIVHPESWSMRGKSWQDVRSSVNRAERLGVRAQWTSYPQLSLSAASQIEEISESWVANHNLPELGFTLGGLDELRNPDVALLLAVGPDDRIEAVTSWMPSYRDGAVVGWTLDFMRRRVDGMNGVMEFLIASAAFTMQQRGIEFMSLSAAPLAVGEAVDADSDRTRLLLDFIARSLEPVYGFNSLLAFKRKFKPEFVQLHMVYRDTLALPAIGAALARAYLPSMRMGDTIRLLRSIL